MRSDSGVGTWRDRLLTYCLRLGVIVGFIALVPSVVISISSHAYAVLWLDVAAYILVLALWLWKSLPYVVRAGGFVATLFVVGAGLLAALGPWGSGVAWTLVSIEFAALLLGRTGGVVMGLVVAVAAVVLGWLLSAGVVAWPLSVAEWAVHMTNLLATAAALALATDYLVTKIESALSRQRHYHEVLSRHHRRLQAHARRQDGLVRELHHRVKNNLQLVMSLLSLEKDGGDVDTYRSRVQCLALSHELIHGEGAEGIVRGDELLTEIRDHLPDGLCRVAASRWCTVEPSDLALAPAAAGPIALLVNELLQTWLRVHHADAETESCNLILSRTGSRMSLALLAAAADERAEAFADQVYGEGGELVEALVGQLQGSLSVQQLDGELTVTISMPHDVAAGKEAGCHEDSPSEREPIQRQAADSATVADSADIWLDDAT